MSGGTPKRRRGRPTKSTSFKLVPVRNATPNAQKLGRAFLALAVHQADLQVDTQLVDEEAQDGTA